MHGPSKFHYLYHFNFTIHSYILDSVGNESVTLEPLQFSLTVIEVATNNFSKENRIGKGGFGEVYKVRTYDILLLYSIFHLNDNLIFRVFSLMDDKSQ